MKYLSFIFLFLALPLSVLAQGTDFVPLTNLPAITEVGNAITTPDGLAKFLNNIYGLCIGIAAVVAVLQIMRAGIMYMGGDSVTEKKEAKNLIALSIGGLILVLSPVVVFSIINPEILSLRIKGIDALKATITSGEARRIIEVASADDCRERGGTVDSAGPPVICSVAANSDGAAEETSCTAFTGPDSPVVAGGNCALELSESYVQISNACCAGMQEGSVCCGKNESSGEQGPRVFLTEPLIYYRYQEYDRVENSGSVIGTVPSHVDRLAGYTSACVAAGGTIEDTQDDNVAEQFFVARWRDCPTNVGVPASTGNQNTVFQCEDRRATCQMNES